MTRRLALTDPEHKALLRVLETGAFFVDRAELGAVCEKLRRPSPSQDSPSNRPRRKSSPRP